MFPLAILVNYFPKRNAENLQKPWKLPEVKKMFFLGGGWVGVEIPEESYRLRIDDSSEKTVFCEQWWLYQRVLLANITENCIYPSTLNNE